MGYWNMEKKKQYERIFYCSKQYWASDMWYKKSRIRDIGLQYHCPSQPHHLVPAKRTHRVHPHFEKCIYKERAKSAYCLQQLYKALLLFYMQLGMTALLQGKLSFKWAILYARVKLLRAFLTNILRVHKR